MVMMKAGVLNNVLYTSEEMAKFPAAWNGQPIPVFHPQENGVHVSANQPKVMEQSVVGKIFNARFDDDRLKAEAWIDIDKANKVDPNLITNITNTVIPMELSTGLFTDTKFEAGVHEGTPYECIAINFRPDHLALLPGGKGACTVEDGAGIPRINSGSEDGGMLSKLWNQMKMVFPPSQRSALAANEVSHDDIRSQLRSLLSHAHPGHYTYLRDVFDSEAVFEAESKVDAVTTLLRTSYTVTDDVVSLGTDAQEVVQTTTYTPVTNEETEPSKQTSKEESPMNEKIDALIANEASPFSETDRALLTVLSEEQIDHLTAANAAPATPAAPAAPEAAPEAAQATPAAPAAITANEVAEMITKGVSDGIAKAARQPIIDDLVANESQVLTAEQLADLPMETLEKLHLKHMPANFAGRAGVVANDDSADSVPEMPALSFGDDK
jgi:hypothetical protein